MNNYYIPFTKEMKRTYTILAPNMLPIHFKLLLRVLEEEGYNTRLLTTSGSKIKETGLKYVHNDACYPAILVIGQFINAIESGEYDPHKVALIYFQTGGGCRASNYVSLLRKALKKAGYGYVPVISFSILNIEKHPGFKISPRILEKFAFSFIYGDLMMLLKNQCEPYEVVKGEAMATADRLCDKLLGKMKKDGLSLLKLKKNLKYIVGEFRKIELCERKCTQVGIVGEIYVKFSPLGNNGLADFLVSEGAEVTLPGLLDFFMYATLNNVVEPSRYRVGQVKKLFAKAAYRVLCRIKRKMIAAVEEDGYFRAPESFEKIASDIQKFISIRCKMGEGWLLPAEMLELYNSGVKNIVCTQPFGCLPNHICGKGMMKPLKDAHPDMNIIALDYDPGVTQVNLENRIKLMLANANKPQNQVKETNKRVDIA